MPAHLERYKKLGVEEVLPLITSPTKPAQRPLLYGAPCYTDGLRLWTFKDKGLKCTHCGIEGAFFAIERSKSKHPNALLPPAGPPFHLNLYALDEAGEEVLMTHDHILARCLGGKDTPENTQTMCHVCNGKKGEGEQAKFKQLMETPEGRETLPKKFTGSRRERDRLSAEKRAKALAESLKNGYIPSGKLSATKVLDDPEAEKIRLRIIRERLLGNMPGQVDISKNDLKKMGMSGAQYVKRLLETGNEIGQESNAVSIAALAGGPQGTGSGTSQAVV
jgi:hypothetical protein